MRRLQATAVLTLACVGLAAPYAHALGPFCFQLTTFPTVVVWFLAASGGNRLEGSGRDLAQNAAHSLQLFTSGNLAYVTFVTGAGPGSTSIPYVGSAEINVNTGSGPGRYTNLRPEVVRPDAGRGLADGRVNSTGDIVIAPAGFSTSPWWPDAAHARTIALRGRRLARHLLAEPGNPVVALFLIIVGAVPLSPGHRGKAQEDVSLEERVLIPGTGPLTRKLVEEVQARPGARYAVVGVADDGLAPDEPPFLTPLRHAGKVIEEIAQRVERLAQGELDPGVELTRGDDMGILAEQVNRLGEQIHAERHARERGRERTEGALDSLEDAVLFLSLQREVIFCNHAAERVLDHTMEAVIGRALEATLPADHPLLPIVSELFEAEHGRHVRPVTLPVRDAPGREVAVSSYRVQEGDQPGGGVLVLRDLEPARAVETLVTYAQKLAALGRLTSGVAHELKNPLNVMRIHLEVLRARLPEPTQEVTENLEVIAKEIQRLDRVVKGFLKFMRPQDLHLGSVDVNALLADVARLAGPEARLAGVDIVFDFAADLPPISGDVELLHQAATNLVTNAIQAMPKGGVVTVTTQLSPDGTVEFRVADQGVGIAPEDLDQIFRLYYTTKEQGSGIGLSLVYRIVQMHEGRIDVASTVGEGTTLSVSLPRRPVGAHA
jgi:signal transduction histidine kinase